MRWDGVCVLRGRRTTLQAYQCYRVVLLWPAQHFVLVRFTISWQAQHFVTWCSGCLDESQCQGCVRVVEKCLREML